MISKPELEYLGVFEAERPGCKFSIDQRIGTYFYKGVLYASVGFACGLIGQGIANLIMTAKRSIKKSEGDIPVPPLVKSAVLCGVFLGVSSNTRYQIINGLERVVEALLVILDFQNHVFCMF
ncbi:protein RETICULATA-RELATED 1, chloroplastic-like isoform X2 [Tasmannia lanceolata]|uniref:protein RETICULATA-RELATED 1, chloroplastic-like isoform X2 n=1 Tax=Tasmannia lanceolata TaxID=3420 RepID=UPI004063C769